MWQRPVPAPVCVRATGKAEEESLTSAGTAGRGGSCLSTSVGAFHVTSIGVALQRRVVNAASL